MLNFADTSSDSFLGESGILNELHDLKLKRVDSGKPVYDFSMINPDIAPSRGVVDRLVQASLKGFNHRYGVSRGLKKLREAFADKYKRSFSTELNPAEDICVTLGSKDALLHLFRVIKGINPSLLVLDPCYPPFISAAQYHGLRVHRLNWNGSEDQTIKQITSFLETHKVGGIVLNFPMNPTGDVVSQRFWSALVNLAKQHGVLLVNDFAYGELVHKGECASLLSVPGAKDVAVEIYTMSKAYNVAGWRVAALLGNSTVIKTIAKIKSKIDYGMFLPVQIAAAGALVEGQDIVSATRETYARRLRVLSEGLQTLGWESYMPAAGASLWVKAPARHLRDGSSSDLIKEMLTKHGVALLPGEAFGESSKDFIRFAAVLPEDKIREALSELEGI